MPAASETGESMPTVTDTHTVDVVIVGAGFAGLSAAERLVSTGASVLVLEGRDRVGGRSLTGTVAGIDVDLGATWVSPRHTAIRRLAAKVGCTITPQYAHGKNVQWLAGRRRTYSGTIPPVSPAGIVDMARIQRALTNLLAAIDVDAAWRSPGAAELDAISFGEWLDGKRALASTRAMMALVAKVQWGAGPAEVSLLHVLRYIRAVGDIDHMLDVDGGQQQDRIAETTQEIAKRLARHLGDRVILDAPVTRIVDDGAGLTVHAEGVTASASYAIVTAAPAHRAGIDFDPPLPPLSEGLTRSWRMGVLSKALIAYEQPFWRAAGLSGEAVTDTGTVFITFDVSPEATGPGILMAFCDPRVFDDFDPETRRAHVLAQLVDLYGERAAAPIDYLDHRWSAEPFAPGGPNPAVAPYATTKFAEALTTAHGRIEWAGTETAGEWAGCMNGAVLTGQRAAERIIDRQR